MKLLCLLLALACVASAGPVLILRKKVRSFFFVAHAPSRLMCCARSCWSALCTLLGRRRSRV